MKIPSAFIGRILITAGLLFAHSFSLADDIQSDAAFTCASAINVMDCITQTGTGAVKQSDITSIPINSQALGFTGPVSVGIRYDNYLAWIMDVGYAQSFYNAAAAFKLSAGLNERRANVTLGYSITPKQQIKLTYEYLTQNLPFDYSTGTVNEWVNQNAFGAAYRYMLDYGIVRALEVYGNYTKGNSKELSDVEMYTDNQLIAINQRRIAGGTQQNYGAAVTLTPFQNTILKVGGGYSTLSFSTEWSDPQKQSTIAYDAELSRLLTPKTMVSAGIGNTAAGQTYTAKVSRILPWSLEGALTGQYMATTNDIPGSTSLTASLSYPAPKTYTNMFAQGIGNLKEWVQQPVIYNTRVLAKAEERKIAVGITVSKPIPATTVPVNTELSPQIKTSDHFSFPAGVYNKIDYTITSVKQGSNPANTNLNLAVTYPPGDNLNAIITMTNPTTQAMIPSGQPITYTVNLEADGYRNGQIVSKTPTSFDITVAQNNTLQQANWVKNPTLPTADLGAPYYGGNPLPLNDPKYITPAIPGETFTFSLAGNSNPSWVTLTSDGKSLIANGNVPNLLTSQTITLKAISQSSGNSAKSTDPNNPENQPLTIPVNASVTLPKWNNPLPNAQEGNIYYIASSSDLNPGALDPYTANGAQYKYLTKTQINKTDVQSPPEDLTFQIDPSPGPSACTWLKITDDKKSLTSNGTVPGGSANCYAYIDVISKYNNSTTLLTPAPLINVQKTVVTLPKWQKALPNATEGTTYLISTANPPTPDNNLKALDPYSVNSGGYLSKTKIGNDDAPSPPEDVTFEIDTTAGLNDPCTWLVVTSDKKSLTSNGQVTKGDCYAYIKVISVANNSIPTPLDPVKIPVANAQYDLPNWTGTPLPNNIINGDAYGPVVLSPYEGVNPAYLTPTYKNKQPLDKSSDTLTFTKDSRGGSGANAACQWLSVLDPQKGTIGTSGGTKADTSCTAYLTVYSDAAKEQKQLDGQKITVITLPTWQSDKILTATGGTLYTTKDLNPYSTNSGGFLSQTTDGISPSIPDNLTNFYESSNNCNDWLKLTNGVLSGTPPSDRTQTYNCTVNLQADSNYKKGYQLPPLTIVVNPPSSPQWSASTISLTLTYPITATTDYPADINGYKIYYSKKLISDPTGVSFSIPQPANTFQNIPSTGIEKENRTDTQGTYLAIKPTTADIDNRALDKSEAVGKFSINATKGGTSSANFNVQVNAELINPQPNLKVNMPSAMVGQDYNPVNIDPYTGSIGVLDRSLVSSTKEPLPSDHIHYSVYTPQSGEMLDRPCTWATIDDSGTITAKNNIVDASSAQTCNFYFNVQSEKNNNVTVTKNNLSIQSLLTAPNWIKNTGEIMFDTTTPDPQNTKNSIDLTMMVDPNSRTYPTSVTPGLKFTFDGNTAVSQGNWAITLGTDQHYYLVRQKTNTNTFDASTVGTAPESITMYATNEKDTTNANLQITVDPDPKITFKMNGTQTINTVVGEAPPNPLQLITDKNNPAQNFLQSIAGDGITLISGDDINATDGSSVIADRTDIPVTYTNKTISIPANLDNKSAGFYKNLVIQGLYSASNGGKNKAANFTINSDQNNPNLTINISAIPIWNPQNLPPSQMRFDAADYNDSDNNGAFSLNDHLDNQTVPQLTFQFSGGGDTYDSHYQIEPNGNKYYLRRVITNDTVDAGDIDQKKTLPIQACSTPPDSVQKCYDLPIDMTTSPDNSPNAITLEHKTSNPLIDKSGTLGEPAPAPFEIYNGSPDKIAASILQTQANTKNNAVHRLITNDSFTSIGNSGALVKGVPSGNVIASFNGQSVLITTDPTTLNKATDPNKYTEPTLTDASTKSGGSGLSINFKDSFTVTLYTLPYFKANLNIPDIRFDAVDVTDQSNKGVIPLNQFLENWQYVPPTTLKFKFVDSVPTRFDLKQDDQNNWYLTRAANQSGAQPFIYADDVNNPLDTVHIAACSNDTCTSPNLNYSSTVLPDSNNVVFGWQGPSRWTIPFDPKSGQSIQCYLGVYDNNDPLGSSLTVSTKTGMRIKDHLGMTCKPNGGNPVGTGSGYINYRTDGNVVGYMGGNSNANGTWCDLNFLVSKPNIDYNGFNPWYFLVGIHGLKSNAYNGMKDSYTNGTITNPKNGTTENVYIIQTSPTSQYYMFFNNTYTSCQG